VIGDSTGARLCFVVLDSAPPQCGTGLALHDWSWDAITVEQTQGDISWVDQIYVAGTYDATDDSFTVDDVRLPTDADRERLLLSRPLPDYSVPCDAPQGGWPARTQEWPNDKIEAIDGYAGAWVDEGQQVMTVKFTGDLGAAEAAVREYYSDALCVVPAEHSAAELRGIQERLQSMNSFQFLSGFPHVDATGEWYEAETIAPQPALQAAFDEQFGTGVVRLRSDLQPIV
jgi:hypothetical protein